MRHGLFLLLFLPVLACAGTPDLREVELHQAYGVTLRWDNVEQTPGRVAGIKPRKPLGATLHTVHLAPGQWVEVRLSAGSQFRLHPVKPASSPLPLQFETSSGSGLYVQQQPGNLPNGDLLLDPQGSTPWLVRVSLEASADRDVEFALFSSRLIELPAVEPYRYRQDTGLRDEHVRYAGDPGAQLFSHLRAGETIELSVEGPVRYRLQQRLLLTGKNHSLRHYQLRYRLDDGVMQVVDASVSTARRRQVLLNGEPVSASNLRNDYIGIPEGRHRLHLQFSEGVLLRILKSLPDDYLLPGLNAPTHHYPAPATSDAGSLTPQQLQSILQPGNPLQTVQQSIMRMIVDNRRRGGGLVGPMTLMAIARSQPDAPALLNEAQVLLNRHSYYDDLLPATTHDKSQQRHFAQRRIREAQDGNDHYLLNTTESGELADKLETAWFTDLTDQGEIDFNLPDRPADSLLRIVILDHTLPARLQLYMDNQPPLPLRLDNASTPDLVHYRIDASRALAAQAVQADHDSSWQLPVQQTRPAAVLEVPLPRKVKNIRILRGDDGQRPVSLALQYRTARPYRLSDSSYLHLLDVLRKESVLQPLWRACLTNIDTALNPDAALPGQLLAGQTITENARSAARAVVNHWVPLLRWLRARQESYRAGIDTGEQPARRNIPTRELNDILTSAKRAERAGHWLPALENWRRLSDSKQVQHRQAALSGSVHALLKLGEYPLAERLLRGSYLSDTPSTMQTLRFDQAYTLYRQQNNSIALEGLLATELSRSQDPQRLSELVVQLVDAGRLKEALGAGMLLPAENRPHHKLLAVTLKRHAWDTFEALLTDIDNDAERALWQGYRAWALDDPESARRHWKMAGSVGATLLQKSREGQHLLTALLHGDKPQRTLATQRLAEWLPQLPGPTVWQPATGRLSGHAGMAWLYSPGLDLGFNTLRARPGQPLQLRIAGPLRLRFDIQPLHDKDQDLPLDGWLRVQSDTQTWISPFTGNRASTTLRWPGSQLRPGRIERRELQLPAGMHQLEISGIDREILVRLSVEAPLLDLSLSQPANLPATPASDWRQLARDTTCTRADKNGFVDCQVDKMPLPVAGTLEQQAINTEALAVELSDTEGSQWHHTRPAPLKSLSPVPQQGDPASHLLTPYQTMVSRLWQLEKSGADANNTIAEMEALTKSVQQQPQASFMRPLLKRATRGADWQAMTVNFRILTFFGGCFFSEAVIVKIL
ncbi:hypothetical protein MNBD_GAMMA14-851 [hydrothermal vent metagenome]|uniref:Uncharacterized protein n=1 Tax=hydrothermal vent metagenome TaxID=652676 RepID=A0A3B0YAF1_9ZZZZ